MVTILREASAHLQDLGTTTCPGPTRHVVETATGRAGYVTCKVG